MKERKPHDYIQINKLVERPDVKKVKVDKKLSIFAIVRLQAQVRGVLARLNHPKLSWLLICEYTTTQEGQVYNVKVMKAA